ncbi:hypothetical protein [Metabacillus iocasae]|uniref:Uncharacterized protein n=1 Tax=Priestia iocasae TaxID=2291674 RepID=A0ABS2QRR7_9BACI|nr:hypothetical protein [Metabacillus iocasae]MBM7702095.1 hypothetical protein [Metabacillus iocasae]
MIKEEVIRHKDSLIKALEILEEGKQEDNTEYKMKKLSSRLNKSKKALDNINFLFEEGEYDIVEYRQRKSKRQEEIKLIEEILTLERAGKTAKIKTVQEQIKAIDSLIGK